MASFRQHHDKQGQGGHDDQQHQPPGGGRGDAGVLPAAEGGDAQEELPDHVHDVPPVDHAHRDQRAEVEEHGEEHVAGPPRPPSRNRPGTGPDGRSWRWAGIPRLPGSGPSEWTSDNSMLFPSVFLFGRVCPEGGPAAVGTYRFILSQPAGYFHPFLPPGTPGQKKAPALRAGVENTAVTHRRRGRRWWPHRAGSGRPSFRARSRD